MIDSLPAGSITISKCELQSASGKTVDIHTLVREFSVFDDIKKPFVVGEMVLIDSVSLITVFPIVGDEILNLEFKTPHPAFQNTISLSLRVVGIENFRRTNARTAEYVLKLVSPEYIKSMTQRVRKSYANTLVSDMANTVYSSFLKIDKELKITDPTSGLRTIVIPNMSPAESLKFLAGEAKSSGHDVSNYTFYQSLDNKFHFTSIEEMIALNSSNDKYYTTDFGFYDDQSPLSSSRGADSGHGSTGGGSSFLSRKPFEFTKILHFNFPQLTQYDKVTRIGALESTLRMIDPVTSYYAEKTYNYFTDYDKFQRTAESTQDHKFIPGTTDLLNDGESAIFFSLNNQQQRGNNYAPDQKPDYILDQIASIAMLENIVVNITIPGDSDRISGDVIHLEFPEYGGTDDVMGKLNKFISGKYLVAATRHVYTGDGYKTAMLCIKNAFEQAPDIGL